MNYDKIDESDFGVGTAALDTNVNAGENHIYNDIVPKIANNDSLELPAGCRIVSVERDGVSFWAHTGKIEVELVNGDPASFFIKSFSGETGKQMVHSEFESMKAIYNLTPEFAPKPVAWGSYKSVPNTYFFLCEYREMIEDMPDPSAFASRLARLHQTSKSPNGKFGFHMTTYSGNQPQMTDWEPSWEAFFAKNLKFALDLEIEAKGHDPEFDELVPAIFDKVIPRLLRPLETGGRSVKPSLVHGDLWYANSGIDLNTNRPLVFDACCFYAHNECLFITPQQSAGLTVLTVAR